MLKKVFAALGATMLAFGLVGGASAATVTVFEGDAAVSLNDTTNYIGGSGDLTARSILSAGFSDVYNFTVQAGGINIATSIEAIFEPPLGGQGIKNLKLRWADTSTTFGWIYITNNSGELCTGSLVDGCMGQSATFPDPFTFAQMLAAGAGASLTVMGTTFTSGGKYNLFITAVPLPAAALLFGSALLGGGLMRRRKMIKEFGLPA